MDPCNIIYELCFQTLIKISEKYQVPNQVCDGSNNCGDRSDEADCSSHESVINTTVETFTTPNPTISNEEDSFENTTINDGFSLNLNSTIPLTTSLETSTNKIDDNKHTTAKHQSAATRRRVAVISAVTSFILILSFGSVLLLRISFFKRLFLSQDFKIQPAPNSRRIPTQLANDLKLNNYE